MIVHGIVALTLLFGEADAGNPEVDCAAAKTQHELTWCAGKRQREAEQTMSAEHAALRAWLLERAESKDALPKTRHLLREGAERLEKLRRAWLRLIEESCEFEGSFYDGGSIRPMIVADCRAREATARAAVLKALRKP